MPFVALYSYWVASIFCWTEASKGRPSWKGALKRLQTNGASMILANRFSTQVFLSLKIIITSFHFRVYLFLLVTFCSWQHSGLLIVVGTRISLFITISRFWNLETRTVRCRGSQVRELGIINFISFHANPIRSYPCT